MTDLEARYFDGKTSRVWPASVTRDGGQIAVRWSAGHLCLRMDEVTAIPAIASAPWRIALPGGAIVEIMDGVAASKLLGVSDHVARWERSRKLAMAAVPAIVGCLLAAYLWGLPLAADLTSYLVPRQMEEQLAKGTLSFLDENFMHPSRLPLQRQRELKARFANFISRIPHRYRYTLSLRDSPAIGPNAFALPGGQIVMTDQLVLLTSNNDELVAVLAHESGHVENRHGIRLMLRSSGLAIALHLMLGDAGSATGALATMPLALFSMKYSRDFETQADDFAIAALKTARISPCNFPTMLGRLQAAINKLSGNHGQIPEWFSSHPATQQRMARYRAECSASAAGVI